MAEAEILSCKLRRYRKMNGLNQFEAASEIGISTETLSKIERCPNRRQAEHGVQDSRIHGDNSFDTIGREWG